MMAAVDFAAFRASQSAPSPPKGLSLALQALWWDAKGDWDKAHERAQSKEDASGCWVHAYLHRKEGDAGNAGYWYRRAGKPAATISLEEEWREIARSLLSGGKGSS
jgi:hypothetical protein